MTTLNPAQMDESRTPSQIFHRSFWQRFRVAIICDFVLYALYCWWFFAIGHVLGTASTVALAFTYLADLVSTKLRRRSVSPPADMMEAHYPRFSPLDPNAEADWVEIETGTMTRTFRMPGLQAPPP